MTKSGTRSPLKGKEIVETRRSYIITQKGKDLIKELNDLKVTPKVQEFPEKLKEEEHA